jgi:hypothetical protein
MRGHNRDEDHFLATLAYVPKLSRSTLAKCLFHSLVAPQYWA